MEKKLYIGNLSYSSTEDSIRELCSQYGEVESVNIITDRDTGRAKGFGFVQFANQADAEKAVAALNGKELDGRPLKVNVARPKESGGRRR